MIIEAVFIVERYYCYQNLININWFMTTQVIFGSKKNFTYLFFILTFDVINHFNLF